LQALGDVVEGRRVETAPGKLSTSLTKNGPAADVVHSFPVERGNGLVGCHRKLPFCHWLESPQKHSKKV
jgi:hypothetical protein